MRDTVTHALSLRPREAEGFARMIGVSCAAHALLVLGLVVSGVLPRGALSEERTVMTISLGGAPGPRSGGMTPMGGLPVRAEAPAPKPEPARPEPPKAAPAREPAMVLPVKAPKPAAKPARPDAGSPESTARNVKAPAGPVAQPGSALVDTGGRGIGFGLSTGGGGTGGEISLGDFCCPEYLTTMLDLIQRNWSSKQPATGVATVRFTVLRDGAIVDVSIAQSSGYVVLDLAAQRALLMTRLPPLPPEYTNPRATFRLNFRYEH